MVGGFTIVPTPKIIFGSGKVKQLTNLLEQVGRKVLLITGKASFVQSEHWDALLLQLEQAKVNWSHFVIPSEPSPEMIDMCVEQFRSSSIEVVVGIGGGSVMDAGKAISAMLCEKGSIQDYLEGVGTKHPSGNKIPFVAVPTTAGTGSEATKNAVISQVGENGFKKSLRHDRYVPDIALVDPELMIACPSAITAQSGMDAFTQLLEAYLSTNSNPFTDALAVEGIRNIRDGLASAVEHGDDLAARGKVAYAALLSGIVLAHAGLGTVHGFASSIGGYREIPHGLICARLMEPVNRITVENLRIDVKESPALRKYARIGKLFHKDKQEADEVYVDFLLDTINRWTSRFKISGLSKYGMRKADAATIVQQTGNKNNPVALSDDQLEQAFVDAL